MPQARPATTRTPSAGAVMSHEEIAAHLGCSTQRAQQLVANAMKKVRLELARRGYSARDFFDALDRPDRPLF